MLTCSSTSRNVRTIKWIGSLLLFSPLFELFKSSLNFVMRVTRSRSTVRVANGLGPFSPTKVTKQKAKIESQNGPITNSRSQTIKTIKTEMLLGETDSCLTGGPPLSQIPKSPASSKKTSKRPHIEQAFAHIKTPSNLELPADFIAYHSPKFVEAIRHVISIDPSLYPAVVYDNFEAFAIKKDEVQLQGQDLITSYWFSLISSIISQQVSGSAAKAIKGRFKDLFTGDPTPKATLAIPLDNLKAVGLLSMKLKYVVHISEVFSDPASNLTSVDFYERSTTEELIAELVKLKGVGEWSANMFAVFTLKELDIFAYDDLGVARGVARYLQVRSDVLDETKAGVHAVEELKARLKKKSKFHSASSKRDWIPIHDEYVKFLALKFQPYRTAFMLLMWRLSSTNIDVLEKA